MPGLGAPELGFSRVVVAHGLGLPRSMWTPQTRHWTRVPCIGGRIPIFTVPPEAQQFLICGAGGICVISKAVCWVCRGFVSGFPNSASTFNVYETPEGLVRCRFQFSWSHRGPAISAFLKAPISVWYVGLQITGLYQMQFQMSTIGIHKKKVQCRASPCWLSGLEFAASAGTWVPSLVGKVPHAMWPNNNKQTNSTWEMGLFLVPISEKPNLI